jgi:hypothetical protein
LFGSINVSGGGDSSGSLRLFFSAEELSSKFSTNFLHNIPCAFVFCLLLYTDGLECQTAGSIFIPLKITLYQKYQTVTVLTF